MTELARARAEITTLAKAAKAAIGDDTESPGALFMSGVINGLIMAAKILDGGTAEQSLAGMENDLATVVGRMYLNGQLPAEQPEPTS